MTNRRGGARRRIFEYVSYAVGPVSIAVTSPLLAQGLEPAGRGELGIAQAVASFTLAIGTLGQAELLIADARAGKARIRLSSRIAGTFGVLTGLSAFVALRVLDVALPAAIVTAAFVPLLTQSQLWRSACVAVGSSGRPAAASALAAIGRMLGLAALFLSAMMNVATSMIIIQGMLFVAALWATRPSMRELQRGSRAAETSSRGEVLDHLRRGSPMIAFSVLTSIALRSDIFILSRHSSPSELGVYAAASALTTSVLAISPAFKTRIQIGLMPGRSATIRRELVLVFVTIVVGVAVGIAGAPVVVSVLLGEGYQSAVPVIRILSVAAGGLIALDLTHGALIALGRRGHLLVVAGTGATTMIATGLTLIPPFGAMGAATGSAISYWTASLVGGALIARQRRRLA